MMKPTKISYVPQMEQILPLIQEALAAGQSVRIFPMGTSMLPMLRQGIDSVVLSPVTGKLKKYDIPLYRRENGKYILHRIVGAGHTYTCMGDNQFMKEQGIQQEQIIAVVTGFYRGDREHSVTEPGYRLYCRIWYHSRSFRRLWRRGVSWLRRHMR